MTMLLFGENLPLVVQIMACVAIGAFMVFMLSALYCAIREMLHHSNPRK